MFDPFNIHNMNQEKKEGTNFLTLSELINRLSIAQLKEAFITEYKKEYSQEIKDILKDIQLLIDESNEKITAETIKAIVMLSQMNLYIWQIKKNIK